MSDVQITLSIPEELAKTAQEFGLLSPEHLIALLEADVEQAVNNFSVEAVNEVRAEKRGAERSEAIRNIRATLASLDAVEPKMTEEEFEQAIREAQTKP